MSILKEFIEGTINTLGKLKIKLEKIVSSIVEAARTISCVETVSNKADTLHKHIKQNSRTTSRRHLNSTEEKQSEEGV